MKTFFVILSLGSLALLSYGQPTPATFQEVLGPRYQYAPVPAATPPALQTLSEEAEGDAIHRWNRIAIDTSGIDHTPLSAGETRVFGEQIGPGRSARAMAIVHIAMFEALNSVERKYEAFTSLRAPAGAVSVEAAVGQAAHDALRALFPSQAPRLDALLVEHMASIEEGFDKAKGITLGKQSAVLILALRAEDGSSHPEVRVGTEWITSDLPGRWRQDPISRHPLALGAHWGECKPFVLQSSNQFRVAPPPAMNSAAYAAAFNEAKRLGGDGITTPTERTEDQTHIGIFWAYDGTPSLCAPPRLYNQVAMQIATQQGTAGVDLARLLALVNISMADSGIAIWESKFHYDVWRPITGIREADPGTGPSGIGDANGATVADPTFTPLGAPASNLQGPNFTPPFPSYPSGHAGFGGALFETLRRFYGRDNLRFTFVSDEFNGQTRGNDGTLRPLLPRSYSSLSQAEEENGQSRIYLGIHWAFDKTEGIRQGRQVADYVFDTVLRPLRIPLEPGDLNGDGIVDEDEVRQVLASYYAHSSPRMESLRINPATGLLQFDLATPPSWGFGVEASSDLQNWTTLPGVLLPSFQILDPEAGGVTRRFYRVVPP